MHKTHWLWQLTTSNEQKHGYVEAVDPRDALSRALTSTTESGRLLGEQYAIPADVLADAPGNADPRYVVSGPTFSVSVQKLCCPAGVRHPEDVMGCGSEKIAGPDAENLFDCCDCGMFFNPLTAY